MTLHVPSAAGHELPRGCRVRGKPGLAGRAWELRAWGRVIRTQGGSSSRIPKMSRLRMEISMTIFPRKRDRCFVARRGRRSSPVGANPPGEASAPGCDRREGHSWPAAAAYREKEGLRPVTGRTSGSPVHPKPCRASLVSALFSTTARLGPWLATFRQLDSSEGCERARGKGRQSGSGGVSKRRSFIPSGCNGSV